MASSSRGSSGRGQGNVGNLRGSFTRNQGRGRARGRASGRLRPLNYLEQQAMMYGRATGGVSFDGAERGPRPDYEPTEEELREWEENNVGYRDYTLLGFNRVYSYAATMDHILDLQENAQARSGTGSERRSGLYGPGSVSTPPGSRALMPDHGQRNYSAMDLLQPQNPPPDFWDRAATEAERERSENSQPVLRGDGAHAEGSRINWAMATASSPHPNGPVKMPGTHNVKLMHHPPALPPIPREKDLNWLNSSDSDDEYYKYTKTVKRKARRPLKKRYNS